MAGDGNSDKLKVFISYSRGDLGFADQLETALGVFGFDPTLDRHGISGGEEWKKRLSTLIEEADTVVFVLSPDSASSSICSWEIEESSRRNKRLIPVLCRPLADTAPPPSLSDLNYVFFYDEPKSPGSGFGTGLARLIAALNTDNAWIREHTRLGALAARWDAGGRPQARLLTGGEIAEAKAWAARQPKKAPDPSELCRAFIRASEDAEIARTDAARQQLVERERIVRAAEQDRKARETALAQAEVALKQTARLRLRQAWGGGIAVVIFSAFGWWGYGALNDQRALARDAARTDIRGQIISYAASAGEEIGDQADGLATSPYTTSIVEKLARRNKPISEAIVDAHQQVTELALKMGIKQRPILSTSMNGPIFLWQQPATRKKRALIISAPDIGVPKYALAGPPHDAAAIIALLKQAGFQEIRHLLNPPSSELDKALNIPDPKPTSRRFTVKQGRFYRATISLGFFEQVASNDTIAGMLTDAGFKDVVVTGSGALRFAEGQWPGEDATAEMPSQIVSAVEIQSLGTISPTVTPAEPPADTLLVVFFSGHGITIEGKRYLLTNLKGVDTNRPDDVGKASLNVESFTARVSRMAAASIVLIDTHFPEFRPEHVSR